MDDFTNIICTLLKINWTSTFRGEHCKCFSKSETKISSGSHDFYFLKMERKKMQISFLQCLVTIGTEKIIVLYFGQSEIKTECGCQMFV
jgi:hypothetical protein